HGETNAGGAARGAFCKEKKGAGRSFHRRSAWGCPFMVKGPVAPVCGRCRVALSVPARSSVAADRGLRHFRRASLGEQALREQARREMAETAKTPGRGRARATAPRRRPRPERPPPRAT